MKSPKSVILGTGLRNQNLSTLVESVSEIAYVRDFSF